VPGCWQGGSAGSRWGRWYTCTYRCALPPIRFATRALAAAPAHAVVATTSDRDTFALWHYHYALGARPDLAIVAEPLLEFDRYRENLWAVYPALRIPARREATWLEAIVVANPQLGPPCRSNPDSGAAISCASAINNP